MILAPSYASISLAQPEAGASALINAVTWLQDILLGTAATSIAILAVAAIGFGMLTGRVDIRRGLTVILGCFILFGASTIVSGLRMAAGGGDADAAPMLVETPPPAPPRAATLPPQQPYDPYAGASVPTRESSD